MKLTTYLVILTAITLSSCARQTSPSGGPKDTIPPTLIKNLSTPKNGSINYDGKTVEIEFDEFVSLNNPKEQIIITPDVEKKYDIVAKKKRIIMTFEKNLQDSTTYTINFRNSVQDITERNSAKNLKIAFSTGAYIDSLSISGQVIDPLTNKDVKQATVALYIQDTFNIFKHKPTIITETDDKGNFIIENLKPNKYHIYAVLDKNKNIIVDSKNESYGFITQPLDLRHNIKNIEIPLQKLDTRTLKLISARPYNSYYNIKTSKALRQYHISSPKGIQYSTFSETTDNIKVYNNGTAEGDSVQIRLQASDSSNNKLDTILYAKFNYKKVFKEQFKVKVESFNAHHTTGTIASSIRFNKPLHTINLDSIVYQIDSTRSIKFTVEDLKIDTAKSTLLLEKRVDKSLLSKPEIDQSKRPTKQKSPAKSEYLLKLGKSALVSIEQDSSTRLEESHRPIYFDETGIIIVEIQTNEQSFVTQLLDQSFDVVQSVRNNKHVTFHDLIPADYQIRLIIDKNADGEWTPGNPKLGIDTEPTRLYRSEKKETLIKLKANFELGPMLIKY